MALRIVKYTAWTYVGFKVLALVKAKLIEFRLNRIAT
jgi:hypothetical protein